MVADKGCHSRETLKAFDDGPRETRMAEPKRDGFLRWHGANAAAAPSSTTAPGGYPVSPERHSTTR
jgi:hypothetical protein